MQCSNADASCNVLTVKMKSLTFIPRQNQFLYSASSVPSVSQPFTESCIVSITDVVLGTRTRVQIWSTRTQSTRTRSRGTCILRYLIYQICLVNCLPVAFYFLDSSRWTLFNNDLHLGQLDKLYFPAIELWVYAHQAKFECEFSKGGLILRPHHAKMSDYIVSSLIFLKCNGILK